MLKSFRDALSLLDDRSKRILALLVVIQVGLAMLDLLGVLLFGVVAALSAAALTGEQPAFFGQWLGSLEWGGGADDARAVVSVAASAGSILIFKSVMSFLLVRRSFRFLANRQAEVSSTLASWILSRPLLDVQRRSSQQTAYALVRGANAATIGVLGSAVVVASEAAVLIVLTVGLLVIDVSVSLFTFGFFVLVGIAIYGGFGRRAKRLGTRLSKTEIASMTSAQNAVRAYREITVSGRRQLFVSAFKDLRWKASRVQADIQIMGQVPKYVFEVALVVGAALLALSQFLTRDITAAIAVIAVFMAAATRIMPALLRLQGAVLTAKSSAGIAAPTLELAAEMGNGVRVEQIHDGVSREVARAIRVGHDDFVADVVIKEICLTYPGTHRRAIDHVSLEVPRGQSLALVGPTGAGKSTIADVILGVIEPDSGSVAVSGVEPTAATQRWPGAIAYVPQDIAILDASVRDNVALGLPDAAVDDAVVWEALERAHLARVFRNEPEGLDTPVGEHGVRLSGGQRQRLGLARALFTRPQLVVLDEATSALDAETEHLVTTMLGELGEEVTLIVVAHRLATIRKCTSVAYIEDGRVEAQGPFDEVFSKHPNFKRQAELLGLGGN